VSKTIHVSAVLVVVGATVLVSSLQADDPQPQARTTQAERAPGTPPPKLTDELRAMNDLQAAHLLVDYGHRAKSPEALLAAARIFATVPVQPMKVDSKDAEPDDQADPRAELKRQAEELLQEARSLAEDLPQPQEHAVNALADAVSAQLKVRLRGVVGGPRQRIGTVQPNDSQVYQFDLVGGFTTIRVISQGDPNDNLHVRVVGSLSGLEYGSGDTAPSGGAASVNFTHLLIAKVSVIITNEGLAEVPYVLRHN
jgi:hypothetical protein